MQRIWNGLVLGRIVWYELLDFEYMSILSCSRGRRHNSKPSDTRYETTRYVRSLSVYLLFILLRDYDFSAGPMLFMPDTSHIYIIIIMHTGAVRRCVLLLLDRGAYSSPSRLLTSPYRLLCVFCVSRREAVKSSSLATCTAPFATEQRKEKKEERRNIGFAVAEALKNWIKRYLTSRCLAYTRALVQFPFHTPIHLAYNTVVRATNGTRCILHSV